jgi:GTP-binding protein
MSETGADDPLVIRSIEFLGGLTARGGYIPSAGIPEIAFAGRSNVGKSSLLNKLVHRKKIARVSRTPGRTREINFFNVNNLFVLADLPGYGYARVSSEAKSSWRPLMEGYLGKSKQLRGVVLLLDVRREPSDEDLQMLDFLAEHELPLMIVVTKVDKLSAARARERVEAIGQSLGLDSEQIIAFSSITGQGRRELAEAVVALVSQPPREG